MPAPHVLVRRATLGYSESTDATLRRIGPDAWLKRQLSSPANSETAVQERIRARYPTLRSTAQANHDNVSAPSVGHQLRAAVLDNALYSDHQLFERTVWFWTDHLN